MPNPFMPRQQVHAWSDAIGQDAGSHQAAIGRLVSNQRRLARFVDENAASLTGPTRGVAIYLIGVILRMYDLAGGRLRNVTWEDIRASEKTVGSYVEQLLPLGEGLVARARGVTRAQPHILDEALYALFEREREEGDPEVNEAEAFKIYLMMWVATEALDRNWTPPKDFSGPVEYAFEAI